MRHLLPMICALALLGCEETTSPKARQAPATSGRRVLFEDASGAPVMKWRVRRELVRVYGADLSPVGGVRLGKDDSVEMMSRGREVTATIQREREGTYRMGERLVLEQGPEGWRLYDGQRTPLGRLARQGDVFSLYPPTGQAPTHTIKRVEQMWVAHGADGAVLVKAPVRHTRPEHVVSMVVGPADLSPLERSALALFWERAFKEAP